MPVTTMEYLKALPYVASLCLQDSVKNKDSAKLTDESVLLEVALLEEYQVCRVVRGIRASRGKLPLPLREWHQTNVASASKSVARNYRRASLAVHPDRHGDKYKTQYENLQEAYNVLQDPDSRHDYLHAMLSAVSSTPDTTTTPAKITEMHENWKLDDGQQQVENRILERPRYSNRRGLHKIERMVPTKTTTTTTTTTTLKLAAMDDGGLLTRRPTSIGVESVATSSRQAILSLRMLRPSLEFRSCCTAILIYTDTSSSSQPEEPGSDDGRNHNSQPRQVLLKRLKGNKLEKAFEKGMSWETLRVTVNLPGAGIWNLYWKASLKLTDGKVLDTTESSPTTIDLTDPALKRSQSEKPVLMGLAVQQAGELRATTHRLQKSGCRSETSEGQYGDFHRLIGKAQTLASRVQKTLHSLDQDQAACRPLQSLLAALKEARLETTKMTATLHAAEKKDSLKSFQQRIAAMMERGEAAEWIATASKEDVVASGAPNRLYQLLVEGKKTHSNHVDVETLENAIQRTDLFSTKQCAALAKRRDEIKAAAETVRLVPGPVHRSFEEAPLNNPSQGLESGTLVKIHSFKDKPELNGVFGTYIGPAERDGRFLVRPMGSPLVVSLSPANFEKTEVVDSTKETTHGMWTCTACNLSSRSL